jgi:O-acetyl-ADP-ribose deacetylase (regulator of RNase III)
MELVKLTLADPNEEVARALMVAFGPILEVDVRCSGFEEIDVDCVVSAGNSFGILGGGVDGAIKRYFGMSVADRVRAAVADQWLGEAPVGVCTIVDCLSSLSIRKPRFIAHAPTMRVPESIEGTVNAYLAMRAVLIETSRCRLIESVVCSGLGTGVGELDPTEAARQMRGAYDNVLAAIEARQVA